MKNKIKNSPSQKAIILPKSLVHSSQSNPVFHHNAAKLNYGWYTLILYFPHWAFIFIAYTFSSYHLRHYSILIEDTSHRFQHEKRFIKFPYLNHFKKMHFSHVHCFGHLVLTSKHNVHAQFPAFHRVKPRCLSKIDMLYLLDISLVLCKGCTKC